MSEKTERFIYLNLYLLIYDDEHYYVEAPRLNEAVSIWKKHVEKYWGDDYDGTEEPQSVQLIHEKPVVRLTAKEK